MKRIAIYLRLSLADADLGEDGKEESNSIENQRLLIRNYLQSHEELIGEVVEYKDDGYSGLNFDRPGFKQMIDDAKCGLISTIIVKDLSRFGRDYIGVGDYLEQILPSLGIRLIAINSKYDSQDQGANILSLDISINNMINNMYSKDLSKKLRSSFRAKWNEGKNPSGVVAFGYTIEKDVKDNKIVIDNYAAEIVKSIFKLAIDGNTTKTIAEKLNEQGVPTPLIYRVRKGKQRMPGNTCNVDEHLWNTHKVLNVIKNYDYTGARVHGKIEHVLIGRKKTKRVPKVDQVVVEDDHPAIISKDDYYNAQSIINVKRPPQNWNKRGDVFSKKLRCGCCGRSLQIYQEYNNVMYCQHSADIGSKSKCNKDTMDRKKIIGSIIYAIRKNVEELANVRNILLEQSNRKFSCFEQETTDGNKILKELSDDLARQYENYVNGNLPREKFIQIKKDITEKRNSIEYNLKKVEAEKDSSDVVIFDLNRTVNLGQAFFHKDKIPDEIINVFLKDVMVHSQDRIDIRLKTKDLFERALFEIEQTKENALADDL